ncbi:MAG: Holliday junction resolvase RuvX [Candidatus Cloacimonetes bacterium]|nr:Holliday junction resolvase RuvX [Candidatus Cloacimonadota bacterium]
MYSRIMAIDYGEKRIGLAITDLMQMFAKPFDTIPNEGKEKTINQIKLLIQEKQISRVVLGLPLGLEGQETDKTREVLKFSEVLKTGISVPVEMWDERLSTYEASQELRKMGYDPIKGRKYIDAMAAYMILKSYLEAKE